MVRERRALLQLLGSLADAKGIDWTDEALRDVPATAVARVRLIARMAETRRTITDGTDRPAEADSAIRRLTPADVDGGAPMSWRWGPLQVHSALGEGTFAEVYRAYNPSLDIEVALKLFKGGLQLDSDRALREARALARVRHEHVVRVHGVEAHDGRPGLWMELVRGSTLETLVAERGPFSAREAALAGQDLCRALAAVHAAELTHGDVTPQNVVREAGGRLVLMDFGAGRRHDAPGPHALAGTPMFLCPEVLDGAEPTPASDLYSLGVLLYYLVTGRYPYPAESLDHLRELYRSGNFIRLHDRRPDLADAFVLVVERAIAPVLSERFQTAGGLRAALAASLAPRTHARGVALVLALAAAALTTTYVARSAAPVTRAAQTRRSVAVLPFRQIGPEADSLYYSEGLADDLTAQLARMASVRVVSGVSVRRYRDTTRTPVEIGHELNVETLVTGSVRVSGDRLLVVVELVDCSRASQLWADTFERPRQDVFAIQNQVIQHVAAALRGTLSPEEASRLKPRSGDYRAFDLYLKGRYYWNRRTPDGLRRSIEYFRHAIAIDPRSALAHAGLADAYNLAAFYHIETPSAVHAEAETAALEAIALEPDLPEAHAALGALRLDQFRGSEAEASLRRAIDLESGYPSAHHWLALWLAQRGRFSEAHAEMRAARAADPASSALSSAVAYIHLTARAYREAALQYRSILDADAADFQASVGLIETQVASGAYEAATSGLADAQRRTGRGRDFRLTAAYVYARAGDAQRSRRVLSQVESELDDSPASEAEIASVHAALGETDVAFHWLERAFEDHDAALAYVRIDPRYDPLRSDRRFPTVLARLDLPAQ